MELNLPDSSQILDMYNATSENDAVQVVILSEDSRYDKDILTLTDKVFGPGRYVKTAERLRENNSHKRELSFIALKDQKLVGSVRLWPVSITDESDHKVTNIVFLGPIVVDEAMRMHGIGRKLVLSAIEAATEHGYATIVLIGAAAYFGPLGFVKASELCFNSPVDKERLLVRPLIDGFTLKGHLE
jgi:predicted N-acetyltransferase YhbS